MDKTEYIKRLENLLEACIYPLEQYSDNDYINTDHGVYIAIAEVKALLNDGNPHE